jgi:hypothetical protein
MNVDVPTLDAQVENPSGEYELAGIYRAIAIAEAEWNAHLERATVDRIEMDGDGDWELNLDVESLQLQ